MISIHFWAKTFIHTLSWSRKVVSKGFEKKKEVRRGIKKIKDWVGVVSRSRKNGGLDLKLVAWAEHRSKTPDPCCRTPSCFWLSFSSYSLTCMKCDTLWSIISADICEPVNLWTCDGVLPDKPSILPELYLIQFGCQTSQPPQQAMACVFMHTWMCINKLYILS